MSHIQINNWSIDLFFSLGSTFSELGHKISHFLHHLAENLVLARRIGEIVKVENVANVLREGLLRWQTVKGDSMVDNGRSQVDGFDGAQVGGAGCLREGGRRGGGGGGWLRGREQGRGGRKRRRWGFLKCKKKVSWKQ